LQKDEVAVIGENEYNNNNDCIINYLWKKKKSIFVKNYTMSKYQTIYNILVYKYGETCWKTKIFLSNKYILNKDFLLIFVKNRQTVIAYTV